MIETALRVASITSARPRSESVDGPFLRFFQALTFVYPILWLIGLAGFYWVLLGLAGAAALISGRRIPRSAAPLVALQVILLASLPVGMVAFGPDPSRVASFFGNLLVWTGLIALLSVAASDPRAMVQVLTRGVLVIGTAQGALVLAAQFAYPARLPVPVLGPVVDRLPSGLAPFATNGLYVPDWLGEVAFRSSGIMAQPTWAGVFGAITVIVAVRELVVGRGAWRWVALPAVAAGLYALNLSLSRSTQISLAVAVAVGLLVALRRWSPVLSGVLAAIATLVTAILLLMFGSQFVKILSDINGAREGSADTRGAIYLATLDLIRQLPMPLIGYGIKPKEDGLVASVATHSAYLGMLFRGGVLGLLMLLSFFAVVLALTVRAADGWAAALATLLTMWCLLEDFDPAHLAPLGIVLAYALTRRERPPGPPPRAERSRSVTASPT